jgi:hypothetical protein
MLEKARATSHIICFVKKNLGGHSINPVNKENSIINHTIFFPLSFEKIFSGLNPLFCNNTNDVKIIENVNR